MALEYPDSRRCSQVDDYHGEAVDDPYRWLEDVDAPEVVAWVAEQQSLTAGWLDGVAARKEITERVGELWDYPRRGAPFERGGRWFQHRNSGLQAQPVLYVMEEPGDEGRVLLDPNLLSDDGTVAVSDAVPSPDGRLLAYSTSAAGSDWQTWRVLDVDSGDHHADVVEWSKFSTAAWLGDGSGFFYGAPDVPRAGEELEAEIRHQRILLHRLAAAGGRDGRGRGPDDRGAGADAGTGEGAGQVRRPGEGAGEDEVVFAAPDEAEWLPHATVTDDGRYLVVAISNGTAPEARLQIVDLSDPSRQRTVICPDFAAECAVAGNDAERFFVVTTQGAERRRIVAVDLSEPELERSEELVAPRDDTLVGARRCGDSLVCWYLRDAQCALRVHELDGTFVREIELPPFSSLGTDQAISGRPGVDLVHFCLTSFTDSGSVWRHDLRTGETRQVHGPTAAFDPETYVTERRFATSEDGTRVPYFCTRRRDVAPTGDIPALLYGYGGFDVPIGPSFSVQAAVFMERGGLYVLANLRGGGEFGRAWHDDGRLGRKQHVFDDFVAVAHDLVASGWTRPERIAANGASNGGLLVGACLTQHPEAFGAAVPEVGVLDMLRFDRFTIGWAWTSDFGSPGDPGEYRWLRAYSPLHNLRDGARYPATMVVTADHDDRVVPGHSFKFLAALQHAQGAETPVLLRVETSAGHGAGKPTSKQIAERADVLTFLEAVLRRS